MSWHGIEGHDSVVEKFRRALGRGRLASSFLFAGPAGIGKRTFALKLAQSLLCQERPEAALDPCMKCRSCTMLLAGNHPDLDVVSKPDDKSFVPIELFLGDQEHRGREGLCHRIAMKPFMGGRRIAVIDDADFLNDAGANCLLKTLEEPPPRSVLILIGTSPSKQLPTIRSRCQLVRFQPLEAQTVAALLISNGVVSERAEAERLATHSEGSLERARELADADLWHFRNTLLEKIGSPDFDSVALAKTVSAFVDEAGKEAPPRRARLRQVIAFAADFYRRLLHAMTGLELPDDRELRQLTEAAMRRWPEDTSLPAACLEECIDAAANIDRNANQSTLIEAWLDNLASVGPMCV